MSRFITTTPTCPLGSALLWEEDAGACRPLGWYPTIDDVPDGGDHLPVHRFAVPTTVRAGGGVNASRHPVLDADGAPLWEGARVSFRVPSFHINTHQGEGVCTKIDLYGGMLFVSDKELNVYMNGVIAARRREFYSNVAVFQASGPFAGCSLLKRQIGDGIEYGHVETFFRLLDDPRRVCEPVPAATPGPSR